MFAAGELLGCVTSSTEVTQPFSAAFAIDASVPAIVLFELVTRFTFRPKAFGSEACESWGSLCNRLGCVPNELCGGRENAPPQEMVRKHAL